MQNSPTFSWKQDSRCGLNSPLSLVILIGAMITPTFARLFVGLWPRVVLKSAPIITNFDHPVEVLFPSPSSILILSFYLHSIHNLQSCFLFTGIGRNLNFYFLLFIINWNETNDLATAVSNKRKEEWGKRSEDMNEGEKVVFNCKPNKTQGPTSSQFSEYHSSFSPEQVK